MIPVRVGRSYLKSVLRIQIKTIEPEPTSSKILRTLIQILPGHKNQIFYFVFFSETLKTFHGKKTCILRTLKTKHVFFFKLSINNFL